MDHYSVAEIWCMVDAVPGNWIHQLSLAIADAVLEYAPMLGATPVIMFALDCNPWDGSLGLALLTIAKIEVDPELADPTEMAAWQHYRFTDRLVAWRFVSALGQQMRTRYEAAADHASAAEAFQRASAEAITCPVVTSAIRSLILAEGFRVSVTNPDDEREYVTE